MIEIEATEDGGSRYRWRLRNLLGDVAAGGVSREPLCDAARQLQRMGVEPSRQISLFRPGRPDWDIKSTIGAAAGLTVDDIRFRPWRPFRILEAA